jgi:subtilisin family serine protease
LILAAAVVGCTQFSRAGLVEFPRSSGDENLFALAATSSNARVTSTVTVSRALDRLDQRAPQLDGVYRHVGTGRGVTVYVFDGGVSTTHPELIGRVRLGYTAFPGDPRICNAHGTAVAGAIAGSTLGVAREAEIVDVKMVECSTVRGTVRAIVEGARWVIEDHKVRGGPAIANWSFIADTLAELPALDSAVAMLRRAGITVIASAGNFDIDACRVSPANATGAFVVGAASILVDTIEGQPSVADRRAPETAYGPCVDVYAPGDSVLLPSLDARNTHTVQSWNGTSMATGYASGAAALYLQLRPNASPAEVADYLRRSATPNTIRDSRSATSRMLYVGVGR